MNFTKKQIANLLSDRILFRFSIHTDFIANFNEHEQLFTFDEFEKVVKSNLIIGSQSQRKHLIIFIQIGKA